MPFDIFLNEQSYSALFLMSFLASTIIPLGSEWLLVSLLASGWDPIVSVSVATAGNTLGACTTYAIGMFGGPFLTGKVLRISEDARQRAIGIYNRYGFWSLLFSWLPVIGDPLCLAGGVLQVRFATFFLLVFSGKFARYALVSLVTVKVIAF